MKTRRLLTTITVAGAVAATLTLSACDMHISFGEEGTRQDEVEEHGEEQDEQNPDDAAPEAQQQENTTSPTSDSTSAGSTTDETASNGTASSGGSTDSGSTASASDSGTSSDGTSSNGTSSNGRSSSGAAENDGYQGPRIGEDGVELDQDGNGKIPADVLEDDIVNAYAEQGTTVDDVDCYADLRILSHRGSQSCTVTAAGKNHYGTVKITSASQSGIGYSLEFPNI